MFSAINGWTFPASLRPEEQISQAAAAGFGGVELTLGVDGPLTFDTPAPRWRELAAAAERCGVTIVGLASAVFFQRNYASPAEDDRRFALDATLRMLDAAAACGAGAILVVTAVVGRPEERAPRVSYADALARSIEALERLRHEAEARSVAIAIENVWNKFLLSPMEAADLVDRINSPWVGWYLDTGNLTPFGYAPDWIATLGGRITRVHVKDYDLSKPGRAGFCPLGLGSVDWPAVRGALRVCGYDGPLTYEGAGEPAVIRAQLEAIIRGEIPSQADGVQNGA
ncbi:MAG: D-tagatose 3-epimerase [Phycisphaerae bacterium]|nr:D-tagatose 3-epimerase [Phycisphaerae bacterium]